ncbi:hypothetical protein [Haloarcula amylovorans]|uniref:hypothetical protein n=1 Tax=Haloarcula amylovorans TaxID=2562280 RepID=UPI001ADD97FB|nr:hypothetical protein [Halomicroarcula amylolytica]
MPKVNEVNEFLEIASDFEDPLEVIRESLSNAYDADATEVGSTIRNRPGGLDIIIEEDVPLESTDVAVCWTLGDVADLKEYERNGYFGGEISLQLDEGTLTYTNRESYVVEILEVKPLLQRKAAPKTSA